MRESNSKGKCPDFRIEEKNAAVKDDDIAMVDLTILS